MTISTGRLQFLANQKYFKSIKTIWCKGEFTWSRTSGRTKKGKVEVQKCENNSP